VKGQAAAVGLLKTGCSEEQDGERWNRERKVRPLIHMRRVWAHALLMWF